MRLSDLAIFRWIGKLWQKPEDRGPKKKIDDLRWLADAPLFIDANLVGSFFDAVVRPPYELGTMTLEKRAEQSEETLDEFELSGTVGAGGFLGFITKAEVSGKAGTKVTGRTTASDSSKVELRIPTNPVRQLTELVSQFLINHKSSLVLTDGPLVDPPQGGKRWFEHDSGVPTRLPRPIVFLDLPSETKFIPTAAEFSNNKIVLLYKEISKRFRTDGKGPEEHYPEPDDFRSPETAEVDFDALRKARRVYWASFAGYYNATKAMQIIEEAASCNGKIRWIDYRLPFSDTDHTIHLHICPSEKYDSGVFGYNMVKRGFKHGIRIVGTVKSEPDINVLAIYEK